VLVVLEDFTVPFDNNQAELESRTVTVQQNLSGIFCGDAGANTLCRIRSICPTWRTQGHSTLDARVHSMLECIPSPVAHSLSLEIPS
jgi:hypothetical protein